jgi:DNA-binding transcriptional MerR regulator
MDTTHKWLLTGDVARLGGLSDETIRRHDAALRPERTPSGRRLYRVEVVLGWLASREQRAAERAAARAAKGSNLGSRP